MTPRLKELHRLMQLFEPEIWSSTAGSATDRASANAVRLQLLTGARMGEVLSARKADFDLNRGVWIKPSHQTKQRRTDQVLARDIAREEVLASRVLSENAGNQARSGCA